jgi:hypothetical protein
MVVQKGTHGALRGIPGTVTVTVNAHVWTVISSYEVGSENKSDEIPGNNSGPDQISAWDYRDTLKLECMAAAATKAAALVIFEHLPVFLDVATIASDSDTEIATGAGAGKWFVKSSTKRAQRDGYATCSMELFRVDQDLVDK